MDTQNNSPVQDLANTGDGRRLLEQALGETGKASDTAQKNPTLREFEYRGDPAKVAPLAPEEAESGQHGLSGTVIFAGFLAQEEYNAKLVGWQGLRKFDEMRKSDATVRWSLQVIKLPIRAAEWRIQEASDSAQDQEIAQFVEWNLFERLPWQSTIREIMSYLDFGFYVAEKGYVAEEYNGKQMVVLNELANRKQVTIYRWEQGDGSPGVTQVTSKGTFDIPENRLMIVTHEREGNNYAGVSLLRSAYKHWYMKDVLYKIAAVAAERQGVGIVKIKAITKPNDDEKNKAIEAAENIRANESGYVVEPENFELNFMDMQGHSAISLGADIEHHDRQIMKNVGAGFMEMGATRQSGSTGGSRSASNDQSAVYELAVEAIANEIEEALNTMVIKQLVDLNFTGVKKYPRLRHNKIGEHDIVTYAKALADLMNADIITPDPDLEQAVRERADLPDLPDDIRENYDQRQRAQAATVPEYAPAAAPGTVPANPAPPTNPPTPPANAAKPKPNRKVEAPKPSTATLKAGEVLNSVKRFYDDLGDQIDAAEQD